MLTSLTNIWLTQLVNRPFLIKQYRKVYKLQLCLRICHLMYLAMDSLLGGKVNPSDSITGVIDS